MTEVCKSCGAEIVFEAGKQSLICTFCGAVNKVERPEEFLETSFDRIVPITVTPHELDNRLYAYMASGNFTPDDMIETSVITLRERYYVPVFDFNIDYEATWTASFGYDRQEAYTAYRSVTQNNRTYQEPYTAYKTVTDWHPANGIEAGVFDVAGYAGKKLNSSPLVPANLVVHAVIHGNSTKYNPSFIKGFEVEGFSVPENKVFESLNGEINANIDKRVKNHAQGDRQRDWHWNARMSHNTIKYVVPICHGAFQYENKEYHVWVGGHDVDAIRADKLPVDIDKQITANIGFAPGILGLISIIGSAYFWGFYGSSSIATIAVLGYGFARRNSLIDYSKSIRNSLLIQMRASNQVANLSDDEQDKVAKAFQRPERPFFAKIPKDKIVLPTLAGLAFFGAILPSVALNSIQVRERARDRQASERANQERRNAEIQAFQKAIDRKATEEQASKRAQELVLAATQTQTLQATTGGNADSASIMTSNNVVKFYFASGKSDLAAGGEVALANIKRWILVGRKVAISGYVDPSGDSVKNAEIAKLRAFAVRNLLKSMGVADDQIDLRKPENIIAGATNPAEGRRVDVTLIPENTLIIKNSQATIQNNTPQLVTERSAIGGPIVISSGFMVVAPEESKQLLTAMLQQATSAFKVSEIKGKIENFAKPAIGDRKAARKMNEQGLAALKSDEIAQALLTLKNATATDPADVEILNNYVYALIKAKRLQDAESEAGRLLTISPGRSSAWGNLAEIYSLKNMNEEAVAALVLVFQFSSDKNRTINFLNERAGDVNSPLQAISKKTIEIIQKM